MGLGEVWWVLTGRGSSRFMAPFDALVDAGLLPDNPSTGIRNYIDDDGLQVPWDPQILYDRWMAGLAVTAQFWISSESDVLVTFERSPALLTLDLSGLTYIEARRVVFGTVNAAISTADTSAVVVDRQLPDLGEEWISFLAEDRHGNAPSRADLLMVPARSTGEFSLTVDSSSWLICGSWVGVTELQ